MTLGEKLRVLRLRRKMTLQAVADAFGINRASVAEWESGKTRPDQARLPTLARMFDTTVDELLSNDPVEEGDREPRERVMVASVPVVGTAQLGDGGLWVELGHPAGIGDGYIEVPSTDRNAYAVRVIGDSMHPRIRSGEFVLCEPNHPYGPGDEVLIVTTDGRSMVKEFLYERDGQIALHSVNDSHGRLTVRKEEVEKIHFVAAIVKSARWRTG